MHPSAIGRLRFDATGCRTEQIELTSDPGFAIVQGPLPGTWAGQAPDDGQATLRLPEPLDRRGTIAMWLRVPEPILSGPDAEAGQRAILAADDALGLDLSWDTVGTQVSFHFGRTIEGIRPVGLPGLPGPQWLHMVWCWDADAGIWEGYFNGTPVRQPGVRIDPWDTQSIEALTLRPGPWAIADLTLWAEPLDADAVADRVPAIYRGALDGLIGARPRGELDVAPLRGEVLYESELARPEDVSDWVMEGPGEARHEDGWMELASTKPDDPELKSHLVFWCPHDFPEDFLLEFDVQPRTEFGLCIVFINANGAQGEDLFDPGLAPRTGEFPQYIQGDIRNYHMSYYANTPFNPGRATCNMRKNPGFYLVDNGPPGIAAGSRNEHHVAVLRQGRTVQLAVDGRRVIRFHDDGARYGDPHPGGKIGLRQMQWMRARYRNLRVHRLA